MDNLEILLGDCRETLKTLNDGSVNCVVTSPPYYGLRDYNMDDQIGQESSPTEFIDELVSVFREVRRVLRDDGTLWINIGDTYVGTGDKGDSKDPKHKARNGQGKALNRVVDGLKRKDLIGIPWRLAFALQADGWYLRQDIIWNKKNAMPSSVKDRCTSSHEYIFLLTKKPTYWYDADAIKEPAIYAGDDRGSRTDKRRGTICNSVSGVTGEFKNKRSVWSVNTRPYNGSHVAVFPPDLIKPCILAGCPEGGVVLDPFGGSGTTAGVALSHNRKAILCELNPDYAGLVVKRVEYIKDYYNKRGVIVDDTLEGIF